jgi:predicted component of type VI protein secretion system
MPTLFRGYGSKVHGVYRVHADEFLIGREDSCDVKLTGVGISRRHCRLVHIGDGYAVEDMGSSNGTFVNGTRIEARTPLTEGDRIIVMGHMLTFHLADEPPEGMKIEPDAGPMLKVRSPIEDTGATKVPPQTMSTSEEYPPTQKVDPKELAKRLDKLLKEEGFDFGKGQEE